MSGPFAIAAASAVLRNTLHRGLTELGVSDAVGGNFEVTARAPALFEPADPQMTPTLNVFLYNVARNTGWANERLPVRDGRGERIGTPLLALDLYYLLIAYGSKDLQAEFLLGSALYLLNESPGFGRDTIRAALAPDAQTPGELQASELAEQLEALKIAPIHLSSEEHNRIWSAVNVSCRPGAAIQVSVLLIESQRPARVALPVRERRLYVLPRDEVRLDRVVSMDGPAAPIDVESRLQLVGTRLGDPRLVLRVNGIDLGSAVSDRGDSSLQFGLRVDDAGTPAPPPALRAGVCGVQVILPIEMGEPPVPHGGFGSNLVTFVLVPRIVANTALGHVNVQCTPAIGADQRVRLLLNQKGPATVPRAYSFSAPPRNGVASGATETTTIRFTTPGVLSGTYYVRLHVDGAVSSIRDASQEVTL